MDFVLNKRELLQNDNFFIKLNIKLVENSVNYIRILEKNLIIFESDSKVEYLLYQFLKLKS